MLAAFARWGKGGGVERCDSQPPLTPPLAFCDDAAEGDLVFDRWRRKRAFRKVKDGDGSRLKPYRFWEPLTRSLFFLELADDTAAAAGADCANRTTEYAVDFHYFSDTWRAQLYRDRRQVATSELPAMFPVPGGVIEVNASTFGLSRMHHVPDGGKPRVLAPHARSAEGLRARFGRRFPLTSRLIGGAAVVILLVGLVVLVPQLVEWITRIDAVAEVVGSFTSPIRLPDWANTSLFVAGILASFERALTLRNHWLIDAETWWLGD